jgi:hypothetical protein
MDDKERPNEYEVAHVGGLVEDGDAGCSQWCRELAYSGARVIGTWDLT